MSLDANRTVREFATEIPHATRVFEKLGIDYCCGGGRSLEAACAHAKVPLEDVVRSLENANAVLPQANGESPDFSQATLTELTTHIVARHHGYVKQEIPRLQQLLAKVVAVHCAKHPELAAVQRTFAGVASELSSHMMKEEVILFPYIEKLEQAATQHRPAPHAPFGSITNPLHMMELEHESAGQALEDLRRLTGQYTPPEDACFSYKTLYSALNDFEVDLHQHIHLENNILFPRSVELERRLTDGVCA